MAEEVGSKMDKINEKEINCPKCNIKMKKLTNGKFIIDKCPVCKGVFLDDGEVMKATRHNLFRVMISWIKNKRDKIWTKKETYY